MQFQITKFDISILLKTFPYIYLQGTVIAPIAADKFKNILVLSDRYIDVWKP